MKFVVLFFVATSAFAQQDLKLNEAVYRDIDSLVGETVNEGENQAHVIRKNNIPDVTCKTSQARQDPDKVWAFCKVNFEVRYESLKALRTCNLLYSYQRSVGVKQLERAKDETFDSCIEDLSAEVD